MRLTPDQLDRYRVILREEIGEDAFAQMSEQELYDSAIRLLELVQIMLESHIPDQKDK